METREYIAYSLLSGTLVMLVLAGANIYLLLFHRKKLADKSKEIQLLESDKKLAIFKSASEAEERERERIARNLHDEINLMLAVHKQVLEKHAFDIESNEFNSASYYDEIANIEKIREAVTACATNLVPAFLLRNGLTTTLEDHIRHINSAGKLKARCSILFNEDEAPNFNKQEELNIYRICLELINNILKHAGPTVLTMNMSVLREVLLVTITHDGKNVSNSEIETLEAGSEGLGLKSIKARSLILKAEVDYLDTGSESSVILKVPFSQKKEIVNKN